MMMPRPGHLPEDVDEVKLLIRALTWLENHFGVAPEPIIDMPGSNWRFVVNRVNVWVFPEPHPHPPPQIRIELYSLDAPRRFVQKWDVTERLFVVILQDVEAICDLWNRHHEHSDQP